MEKMVLAGAVSLLLAGCVSTATSVTDIPPVFANPASVTHIETQDEAAYRARFEDEVLAAEATMATSGFSVRCENGRFVYRTRVGQAVSETECEPGGYLPTLVREKVTSDNTSLLLVLGNGMGILSDGAILRVDEAGARKLTVIPIENMWMFGPVLGENRLVLVTGGVTPTGCGIIRYDKEVTVDWAAGRIVSERTIPSPPVTCAEAPNG